MSSQIGLLLLLGAPSPITMQNNVKLMAMRAMDEMKRQQGGRMAMGV